MNDWVLSSDRAQLLFGYDRGGGYCRPTHDKEGPVDTFDRAFFAFRD